MKKTSEICSNIDTVESFCGCIQDDESANETARDFCDRAKANKEITDKDLANLKIAITDPEYEKTCCGNYAA
jgi:hypothetical protein